MAVKATVAVQGEAGPVERELYIRLNNFEQLANHGVPAIARFRGFALLDPPAEPSAAFDAGGHFLFEQLVEFEADVGAPIWTQAYAALTALPAFAKAVEV